jgi:hypothetical protein
MSYAELGNCKRDLRIPPPIAYPSIDIRIEEKSCSNIANPDVWGQAFWFINHLGALHAPEVIDETKRRKYWGFIDGIPEMLACSNCSDHAREYIHSNEHRKEQICSSRESLIQFFTDFHNSVNQRTNKPLLSIEDIKRMFSGNANVQYFRYS